MHRLIEEYAYKEVLKRYGTRFLVLLVIGIFPLLFASLLYQVLKPTFALSVSLIMTVLAVLAIFKWRKNDRHNTKNNNGLVEHLNYSNADITSVSDADELQKNLITELIHDYPVTDYESVQSDYKEFEIELSQLIEDFSYQLHSITKSERNFIEKSKSLHSAIIFELIKNLYQSLLKEDQPQPLFAEFISSTLDYVKMQDEIKGYKESELNLERQFFKMNKTQIDEISSIFQIDIQPYWHYNKINIYQSSYFKRDLIKSSDYYILFIGLNLVLHYIRFSNSYQLSKKVPSLIQKSRILLKESNL